MIEQQYPSGRLVKNALDSDGDLATVQSKKNANHAFWNFANHFSYNAAGAITSMRLGNGRWESTQFNSRLQPTQIALGNVQNGTDKLKLNYEYGELYPGQGNTDFTKNNGNISKQTITVGSVGATPGFVATQYYGYDALNRIQIATENITPTGGSEEPSWRQNFSYDRYGNRNFVTTGATPTTTLGTCPTEVCNPSISPTTNKITSTGYSSDAAGNTTRDAQDRKFRYDAENKQTKVESLIAGTQTVNGTIGEYFYDGDGRRVKKRAYENGVPAEETIFAYDAAGKLIGEYSNDVASSQYAQLAYLTNDHLGSPRINTDINGNVTSRHDYHPFGEEVASSKRVVGLGYADDTVRKQFTGYEHDAETDLNYTWARTYGDGIGRFHGVDPFWQSDIVATPQGWNRYQYCLNNPLLYIDPLGLQWLLKDGKYYYVQDEIYRRDKENYKGYTEVENGTIFDASKEQSEDYQHIAGKRSMLMADGSVNEVDGDGAVIVRGDSETIESSGGNQIGDLVLVCSRVADLPGNSILGLQHMWLRTRKNEAGAGPAAGGVPGQGGIDSPYITQMTMNPHQGESLRPEASCYPRSDLNVRVVDSQLQPGRPLGGFHLFNNCQTTVRGIVERSNPVRMQLQTFRGSEIQ